ncbi:MAG: hypothetical protein QM661_07710 [Solimonas sp.]
MHSALLLATLAALACGPLLYTWARPRRALLAFLDGFLFVSIFGLVLLEVLPGTFSAGGPWSVPFVAIGLLGPTLMEHGISRARREMHLAALTLAMLGLVVHSLGDGVALSSGGEAHVGIALPLAVAVHSVPVGLMVWWLLYPVFGRWPPLAAIIGMCAGTIAGYAFGPALDAAFGTTGWAWFQALVAGSILHVVFGRPHLGDTHDEARAAPRYEGLGNLCALAGLLALAALEHEPLPAAGFLAITARLALLAAPWLLAAYGAAALALARGDARRALRLFTVDLVDRSAAWIIALLLLASVGVPLLRPALAAAPAAGSARQAALLALLALYAASLLRRGGRAWIATLLPRAGHRHAH